MVYQRGRPSPRGEDLCCSTMIICGMLHVKFPRGSPLRNSICRSAEPTLVCRALSPRVLYRTVVSEADGAVEQMYDVLSLLVDACVEAGDIPIVGGDFNACIGLLESDDLIMLQHVGPVGRGQRNARGTMLIHWILQNKFYIFNRDGSLQGNESWTCRRASDGNFVQLDFIIGDAYFYLKKAWYDYCIPIGNDHRCVHCVLSHLQPYKQQYRRKQMLKGWKPNIDDYGEPSTFQTLLETKMGEQNTLTFDAAEHVLMSAAVATGTCVRHKLRFIPSDRLRN